MNKERLAKYSFYLWLLAWPWQTKWILSPSPSNYLEISIFLSWIFLIIPLSVWGYPAVKNDYWRFGKNKLRPLWWWGLIILEAAFLFSIPASLNVYLAIYRYVILIIAVLIFYLLKNSDIKKEEFSRFFIGGLIAPASLAIWQFFSQSTFSSKWLGLASHPVATLGTSVIESNGLRYLRAYGSFDHPNVLGGVMALMSAYLLYVVLASRDNKKYNLFYLTAFILFYSALLLSFSRSALLAFWVSAPFIFIHFLKTSGKRVAAYVLIIAVISCLIGFSYRDLFFTRLSSGGRLESKSIQERASYIEESISLIKKNPLWGVGAGNYVAAREKADNDSHALWFYQPVHNYWLLAWAEVGILGLLGVFIFWLSCFFASAPKRLWPLILAFAIISVFDHWLWTSAAGAVFIFMVSALIFRKDY